MHQLYPKAVSVPTKTLAPLVSLVQPLILQQPLLLTHPPTNPTHTKRPGELASIRIHYSAVRTVGYAFPVRNPVRVRMLTTVNDALLSEYDNGAEEADAGPAPRYVPSLADVNRLYHGKLSKGIVFRASVALSSEILEEEAGASRLMGCPPLVSRAPIACRRSIHVAAIPPPS